MISQARMILLAEYFKRPIDEIRHFLTHSAENDPHYSGVRFLWLAERVHHDRRLVEYCLLCRNGRFLRLLDQFSSSVDIREAAAYIDSVEPAGDELEIVWDIELEKTKYYYRIRDYCPPLYCGPDSY